MVEDSQNYWDSRRSPVATVFASRTPCSAPAASTGVQIMYQVTKSAALSLRRGGTHPNDPHEDGKGEKSVVS